MKIISNTVGTPLPKPDLKQTDPKKGDYVKGKDLIPTKVSQLENDEGYLKKHQDLSGYALKKDIPTSLSSLSDDASHRTVTDTEKSNWNKKAETSAIPKKLSDLENDLPFSGFVVSETPPTDTSVLWVDPTDNSGNVPSGGESSGGAEKEWELIESITTTEVVNRISVDIADKYKELVVFGYGYYDTKGNISAIDVKNTIKLCQSNQWFYDNNPRAVISRLSIVKDRVMCFFNSGSAMVSTTAESNANAQLSFSTRNENNSKFESITLWSDTGTYKVGFLFKVWGR